MTRRYQALIGRIQIMLNDLDRIINRAESLCEKALRSGDDGYWDGVALNLHGFYAGVEQIFEDIAKNVEVSLPTGPDWHRDLLVQMTTDFPSSRPAVISQDTRRCLDEYRGFRYVVRNVYTFNLRSSRLQELADGVRSCMGRLEVDLTEFMDFLGNLDRVVGE